MIPDFQSMILPVLQNVSDEKPHSIREVVAALAGNYQLTEEELQKMLPSGQQTVFSNRVHWAKAHLKKAGLVESPSRGTLLITAQGKELLRNPPEKITIGYLKQFPSFDWHKPKAGAPEPETPVEETEKTPEELLDASYQVLKDQLAAELLERVRKCSPPFFERLAVELLVAMGYGGSLVDAGQAIGRAGDGGIDGIIKEDKLGLDVVYIQAKRWENTVGRPVVQAFAGSMEGFRARKGVLITTGAFSGEAEEYVSRIERKIVLIDGKKLAEFMVEHGVGVTTARTYAVKRIDLDYFAEEEGS